MFLSAGKCPIPQIRSECPDTPSSLCSFDLECPGLQKCCDDGCLGFLCEDPCKWGGRTHTLGLTNQKYHVVSVSRPTFIFSTPYNQGKSDMKIGCPEYNSIAIRTSFAITYLKLMIAARIE